MEVKIIYEDEKDREFLNLIDSEVPIFIDFIGSTSKEAYRIKSHWAARKNPFVVITNDNEVEKVFYSDAKGSNAIQQLITYLNDRSII